MFAVKNSRDVLPICVTGLVFSLQLTGMFLSPIWATVLAIGLLFFCGTTAAFQHHHGHCTVFQNKRSNEILDSLMSFQTGITPYAWVLHHNIGHHGNYMNQYPKQDDKTLDASNWSRDDGSVMKRWEYVWYNRVRMHSRCSEVGRKAKKIFTKYIRFRRMHFMSLILLLSLGFWFNGISGLLSAFILFGCIPQFMVLMVFEATYDHHSGLFTDNKYEASRNTIGYLFNFFRLNLGYHTAHHIKPGLHWSELPKYHASIEKEIPESLIDRNESFIQFLIRSTISDTRRKA